jgi:tetratricopeptide (TPR) repeat protein
MNGFYYLILLMLMVGCTTGRLSVDAAPGDAELFMRGAGQDNFVSLGKTPYIEKVSVIQERAKESDSVVLEVRKAGYISKAIVLSDIDSKTDIKINFKLPSIESFMSGKDESLTQTQKRIMADLAEKRMTEINSIVDQLFVAQRMAQVGRYQDADDKLKALEKEFPNVSAIYEIQGGIAYIQKDYPKALDAYTKAALNNPFNLEVINMKNFLQKKVKGTRTPTEAVQ